MKKLCCKIELRIAKIIQKVEDDVLGEMLYYSDGYIILENLMLNKQMSHIKYNIYMAHFSINHR